MTSVPIFHLFAIALGFHITSAISCLPSSFTTYERHGGNTAIPGIWPSNPALPLPEHTTPTHELITHGVLGPGQHPPHQTDTHTDTSILPPSHQDSDSLSDSGHSPAFCYKQTEEQTRKKTLTWTTAVLCFDEAWWVLQPPRDQS